MSSEVRLCVVLCLCAIVPIAYSQSQQTYDFIVVGSGAGGGAITRRLVETGKFKVLLIESGGQPRDGHDIPVFTPRFLGDPGVTFQLSSVPQRNAALYWNTTMGAVSGRMLGGTTSLNYMWFMRGHPSDWDNWAHVTGDPSWNYKNMLKYMLRVESYEGDYPNNPHGYYGPITISRPRYAPGLDVFLQAGRELGFYVGDPNGPQKLGFTPVEYAKRRGRRVSSYYGYLGPVLNNPNLHILINTNVSRVLFQGNSAVGVEYITNTTNRLTNGAAYATREVIICAGSYNSPLILQRSGIGPRNVLQAAGIPVRAELATGLNLQDHAAVNLNFFLNNHSLVIDEERDLTPEAWNFFNLYGDGPFTAGRGATGQALLASSVTQQAGFPQWPDLQLCMSHSTIPYVNPDDLHETANASYGEIGMSSSVFIGRPHSRGSVMINPQNPLGDPILDFNVLSDPRDLQMFMDGIQYTLRIYEGTQTYAKYGTRYAKIDLPACDRFQIKTYQYWECYIRHVIQGGCHPAGTNKMGAQNDPYAVVDTQLKVRGFDKLRVVDASVMPFVVNANPSAAVYAMAERIAEMLIERWAHVGPVQNPLFGGHGGRYGGEVIYSRNKPYSSSHLPQHRIQGRAVHARVFGSLLFGEQESDEDGL